MSNIEISGVRRLDKICVIGREIDNDDDGILFEGTVTDERTMSVDVGDFSGHTIVTVHNPSMRLVPFQCSFFTHENNTERIKVKRVYSTEEQTTLTIRPDDSVVEENKMLGIYNIPMRTVTVHGSITSSEQYMLVISTDSGGHGISTKDMFVGDYDELLHKALDTHSDEYRSVIMFAKLVRVEYESRVSDWKEYQRLKMKFEGKKQ